MFQPITGGLKSPDVSFEFIFPSGFAFNGTPKGLLTPNNVFPDYVAATVVESTTPLIITQATAGTDNIPNNLDNRIQILSAGTGIVLPSYPGTYFIEMLIYNNGNPIEGFLYEMEVLPAPMTGSVKSFSYDTDVKSLYEIQFTPLIDIPRGRVPDLPIESWGTIDVQFPTMNSNWQPLWPVDLGTGGTDGEPISCKGIKNIDPATGEVLACKLLVASKVATTTYVTIRITNFNIIYAYVPVTIHIANIINPNTPDIYPYATVVTYSITQRVYQVLNKEIYNLPSTSFSDFDPTLPMYNGRSMAPIGDGTAIITFMPNIVNTDSRMSFILWSENDVASGGTLLIKFPDIYPLPHTPIICAINYATDHVCYTYPVSGWISILDTQFALLNHVEYTITIDGLKNPVQVEDPASAYLVAISDLLESEYLNFQNITYFDPGAIDPVNVFPSSYNALAPDVTYSWLFTCPDDIPEGGKIVLTFPKTNFVLDTYPVPTCTYSGLADSKSSSISCEVSGNTIIITGFALYTAGNEIQITVSNILNPGSAGNTDYFQITTFSAENKLIDANYYIPKIKISTKIDVGVIDYVDFYADPNNGDSLGDYTISILPSVTVPDGSFIVITFPSTEFDNLNVAQMCSLKGGLSTLETCYGDGGNIITVVTNEDYIKNAVSVPINITIHDIRNFAAGLTSGVIEVEIFASGVLINTSPESEKNRKVQTGLSPGKIVLDKITNIPLNPDERAVYNMTFTPSTSFNSSCYFIIKFPEIFPRSLSEKIKCSSQELETEYSTGILCIAEERRLKVYNTIGFDPDVDDTFTLTLEHIRNPAQGAGSYKFVFYSACGYLMQDYGEYTYTIANRVNPANMYLTEATTTGNSILYTQEQVYLVATTASSFNSVSDDLIIVDFPVGYDQDFVGDSILCNSDIIASQARVDCSYESNRVKIKAFSNDVDTTLFTEYGISLVKIENPDTVGQARYLKLGLFKASQDSIFAKTFDNLNRINSFSYDKKGIEVVMNESEDFTLNAGTRTSVMKAVIITGSPQTISISAMITNPTCYLVPSRIEFTTGIFEKDFQISCKIGSILGYFHIEWTYEGVWPNDYWSPIKRSFFQVTDDRDETITIGEIDIIPQGGESFPISITLSHPVDNELNVTLSKIGIMPTGAEIFPTNVTFVGGEYEKTFVVSIDKNSYGLTGQIMIEKSGDDEVQYSLVSKAIKYSVGPEETTPPIIAVYQLTSANRHSATFTVVVDDASNIH